MRVTSDFWELKALTIRHTYPMEGVHATLDWMASIFSTFDRKDGFSQIVLDEESRNFTAIRTVLKLLRNLILLKGLKNAPAVYQRIVQLVLGDRKGVDIGAFMDDVSLGTATVR